MTGAHTAELATALAATVAALMAERAALLAQIRRMVDDDAAALARMAELEDRLGIEPDA